MKDETMNTVLLGPPGAGKGTQAENLSVKYGWPQVATGDMFRAALDSGTPLGLEARKYLDAGELVPDEVVEKVVAERLSQDDCAEGFILDGFPRNVHQAGALERYLAEESRELGLVANIEVDEEMLVKRISGRRVCSQCGSNSHVTFSPPAMEGRCDSCGGELYQRSDDLEETVRHRLEVYREQTEPLIAHYRPGGRLITIDGSRSTDEVFADVCAAVDGMLVREAG